MDRPGGSVAPISAHPRLHAVGDVLAVLALQHDDHAGHALALAVARDGALARHRADRHVRDVADVDGRPLDGGDDDVPQVVDRLREPDAAHGVALGPVFDEAAAEGGVVVGQGLEHLPQGEPEPVELPRVHQHLELPRFAAPRVDLAHAAHRAQARADVPVVEWSSSSSRRSSRPPSGTDRSRRTRWPRARASVPGRPGSGSAPRASAR